MSNYTAGHNAEKQAAEYLSSQGFQIKELNWKTRYCEIDIIAEKKIPTRFLRRSEKVIYFVETKYRRTDAQGYGVDYVTPRKLEQMRFAAEMWVQQHGWEGDYQLGVVSIDGEQITFIDEVL